MRALIAERMVLEPASAADAAHLLPVRAAAHDADAPVHRARPLCASLVALSVAALRARGVLPVPRLRRPAGRAARAPRWPRSRWRLAASPAGVDHRRQRGALSSALGRARSSGCWRRSTRGRWRTFAVAGLLASLAAVTRYDAWLALPMVAVAAWWFARSRAPGRRARAGASSRWRRSAGRLAGLGGGGRRRSAVLRALHLQPTTPGWARRPRRATALAGAGRQLGVWSLAFLAAMTPPGRCWPRSALERGCAPLSPGHAGGGGRRARRRRRSTSLQGSSLQSFEPLARFALVPGRCCCRWRSAPCRSSGRARFGPAPSPRRPRFPSSCGWSPPSGASGSGPAPNRWGRSPGSTARIARWPPTCAPSAAPASA